MYNSEHALEADCTKLATQHANGYLLHLAIVSSHYLGGGGVMLHTKYVVVRRHTGPAQRGPNFAMADEAPTQSSRRESQVETAHRTKGSSNTCW